MLGFTEIVFDDGERCMMGDELYEAVRKKVLNELAREEKNAKTTCGACGVDSGVGATVDCGMHTYHCEGARDSEAERVYQRAVELMAEVEAECAMEETEFVTDQYNLKDEDLEISIARTKCTGVTIEILHGDTHRLLSL